MKKLFLLWAMACMAVTYAQDKYGEAIADYQQMHKNGLVTEMHIDTSEVKFFPVNRSLIITATIELLKDEPVFNMITSSGKTKEAVKFAIIRFTYQSHNYELTAYQLLALQKSKEYADYFFIPFKDAGTDRETYHGGRYLDFAGADIKEGKLTLDFNKAYNPNCAYTTGYNCPLPPAGNRLAFVVNAGVMKFEGH